MTKVIGTAIVIGVCFIGWTIYKYWLKVDSESTLSQVEYERLHSNAGFDPSSLQGMPPASKGTLENSLAKAQSQGTVAMRDWIKSCRSLVQDPRMAWIELDYVVMLGRSNPAEAKKVFAEVKQRTPPSSPVYERIKQLEKTYE